MTGYLIRRVIQMSLVLFFSAVASYTLLNFAPGGPLQFLTEITQSGRMRITEEDVLVIERSVERFNAELEPLKEFVLPGGTQAAALCHVARTVCRRAETRIVALRVAEPVERDRLVPYLNRLSDLLFVAARLLNKESGREETLWRSKRRERR